MINTFKASSAYIEELRNIINTQRKMIESQAETIRSLRSIERIANELHK